MSCRQRMQLQMRMMHRSELGVAHRFAEGGELLIEVAQRSKHAVVLKQEAERQGMILSSWLRESDSLCAVRRCSAQHHHPDHSRRLHTAPLQHTSEGDSVAHPSRWRIPALHCTFQASWPEV